MVEGGRERDILEAAKDVTTAISLDIRFVIVQSQLRQ